MTFVEQTSFDKVILPERLYKYRNWRKPEHKRMLTHFEGFFAAPNDLEEHWECNLPRDYYSVTPAMIFAYAYETAPSQGIRTNLGRLLVAVDMAQKSPFYNPSHRKLAEDSFRTQLNNRLSIFSASEHRDVPELWGNFALNHQGFCVGMNTRLIFTQQDLFGGGGAVDYYPIKSPPKIRAFCMDDLEMLQDMMKIIYSLPGIYAREDEYRLTKIDLPDKQVPINPVSIEEVILGSNMPTKDQEEIIETVRINLPNTRLIKASFDKLTQTFSFAEINQ